MSKTNKFEIISIHQFSKLAMVFWVGGTLTIGIVVIPLLFKTLDEITAANLAGQLLNINAYIGIVALLISSFELIHDYKFKVLKLRPFWYVVIMALFLIINYFAIFPIIAKMRKILTNVATQVISYSPSFGFWHSVSSLIFIIICVLGTLYILEKN